MTNRFRTFAELQMEIHEALRAEHPEWIQLDGKSPICDLYEARLAELLDFFADSSFDTRQDPCAGAAQAVPIIDLRTISTRPVQVESQPDPRL
jgi:hypothetical protein